MEGKNTALLVLGIVVVIAIVGLVLLFQTASTGKSTASGRNSMLPYPGGVVHAPAQPPIVTESPGAVVPGDDSWRKKGTVAVRYGEPQKSCADLTYVGTVQHGYSEDATYSQAKNRDCVYVEGSPLGFCCRK